jgi:Multiubiquitin
MEQDKSKESGKDDAHGQNKVFIILVNAREKEWSEKKITYDQVIVLAFGSISTDPNVSYSVTYKKGDDEKPDGIMVSGDEVKVKDGMRFNVTQTNRS